MHHPFAPLMLLVLAPVLAVAYATGLRTHRAVRWAIAVLGGLLLAASVGGEVLLLARWIRTHRRPQ